MRYQAFKQIMFLSIFCAKSVECFENYKQNCGILCKPLAKLWNFVQTTSKTVECCANHKQNCGILCKPLAKLWNFVQTTRKSVEFCANHKEICGILCKPQANMCVNILPLGILALLCILQYNVFFSWAFFEFSSHCVVVCIMSELLDKILVLNMPLGLI